MKRKAAAFRFFARRAPSLVSLRRIAEDTSQQDRIAQAFAIFDAYKAALYRQHDIGLCNRPTRLAKAEADRALVPRI